MNRLRNLLAVIDFSEGARAVLSQAARLARWNQARLHLLLGLEEQELRDAAEAMLQPRRSFEKVTVAGAQAWVRQLRRRVRLPAGTRVEVVVGPVIDLILRRVAETKADLAVMGVRGAEEGTRGAGVLATRMLRKTATKVLLVEPGKSRPFRRLVACVDFSETSREVVTQALRIAEHDQAEVDFLHVFFAPWRRFGYRAPSPTASVDFARDYRARVSRQLQEWVGDGGKIRVRFRVMDAPRAGVGIVTHARKWGADLIVLGRRGRSELGYLLLGSTAERLARELTCSLLTVQRLDPVPLSTLQQVQPAVL